MTFGRFTTPYVLENFITQYDILSLRLYAFGTYLQGLVPPTVLSTGICPKSILTQRYVRGAVNHFKLLEIFKTERETYQN